MNSRQWGLQWNHIGYDVNIPRQIGQGIIGNENYFRKYLRINIQDMIQHPFIIDSKQRFVFTGKSQIQSTGQDHTAAGVFHQWPTFSSPCGFCPFYYQVSKNPQFIEIRVISHLEKLTKRI
jgi:hypothetical protein